MSSIEGITFREGDEFVDVIVHSENGGYVLWIDKVQQPVDENTLAQIIAQNVPSGKTIRLLSCSDLESATKLSESLNRNVIASKGYVDIYKDGGIKCTSDEWFELTPDGKRNPLVNKPQPPDPSETRFVRMGTDLPTRLAAFKNTVRVKGFANLEAKVANLTDDATKTRFLDDFEAASDDVLRALDSETGLVDVWKGVKYEVSLRKNVAFLANLSKSQRSNLAHHLIGEINERGLAVGLHLINAVDNVRTRIFRVLEYYPSGEPYKAVIEIMDSNGNWVRKKAASTFFDSSYDVDKVIEKAAAIISDPANKIADRVYKISKGDGKTIVVELTGSLDNLKYSTMYLEP